MARRPTVYVEGCNFTRHENYVDYYLGCRCQAARDDLRNYEKRRRGGYSTGRSQVAVLASSRRIQALTGAGWGIKDIAKKTNLAIITIHKICHAKVQTVQRSTEAVIEKLYRELELVPGPSSAVRARAHRNGFPPPFAWDEEDFHRQQGLRFAQSRMGVQWNRDRFKVHGTETEYRKGCRCVECKKASSDAYLQRRRVSGERRS